MFYICTNFKKPTTSVFMLRKRVFTLLLFILSLPLFRSQRHEVGVQLGMNNLVGDIGRTGYILQKPFGDISGFGLPIYAGLIYRMNFNPYQTLRFNLGYSNVQFNDVYAKETYRRQRNLSGTNSVTNLDVQFEYNFLPVNNEQQAMLSPYIFGGLGGIIYSTRQITLDFSKKISDANGDGNIDALPQFPGDYKATSTWAKKATMSIPFGAGLKYKFNYNWAVFGEFKFRYTFTDNIDYSKLSAEDVKVVYDKNLLDRKLKASEINDIVKPYLESQQIGNPNSNDWVNYITIGLSYSFGRPPCYCD